MEMIVPVSEVYCPSATEHLRTERSGHEPGVKTGDLSCKPAEEAGKTKSKGGQTK